MVVPTVSLVGPVCQSDSSLLSFQADDLPDLPPQTVTEEKYTDEHGNMVVKKVRGPPGKRRHWNNMFFSILSSQPDHAEGDP